MAATLWRAGSISRKSAESGARCWGPLLHYVQRGRHWRADDGISLIQKMPDEHFSALSGNISR